MLLIDWDICKESLSCSTDADQAKRNFAEQSQQCSCLVLTFPYLLPALLTSHHKHHSTGKVPALLGPVPMGQPHCHAEQDAAILYRGYHSEPFGSPWFLAMIALWPSFLSLLQAVFGDQGGEGLKEKECLSGRHHATCWARPHATQEGM